MSRDRGLGMRCVDEPLDHDGERGVYCVNVSLSVPLAGGGPDCAEAPHCLGQSRSGCGSDRPLV